MYLFIFIVLNILIQYSQSCSYDWECGNTPYTLCKKNYTSPFHKIDIDKINKRLFFSIQYAGELEKRIISIPLNGSNGFNAISHATIYGQDTYQILSGLSQFVGPKSNDFIVYGGRRIIGTQNYVWYKNNTIGPSISSVTDSAYIFDEENSIQYVCHPYSGLIWKGQIKSDISSEILYENGCSGMKTINNNLYIQYSNKIYLGTLNPTSKKSINSLPIIYTIPETTYITSFDVSSTDLYYIAGGNIYKVSLSSKSRVLLYSDINNIQSMIYFEDHIYFLNKNQIKRVSTITSIVEILFNFENQSGHCICAQGYRSSSNPNEPKCSSCDLSTNIQSWVNGVPRCIPLNWRDSNNPIVCNYDYQCFSGTGICKEKVLSGGTFTCQKGNN